MRTILITLLFTASSMAAVAQRHDAHGTPDRGFAAEAFDPVTGNQICETTVSNSVPLLRAGRENVCPFPAMLEGAHPTIEADQDALKNALERLRADARTNATPSIASDQDAIRTSLAKLQADSTALRAAIRNNPSIQAVIDVVTADLQAMDRDRVAAYADEIADDRDSARADRRALLTDFAKLIDDLAALRSVIAAIQL